MPESFRLAVLFSPLTVCLQKISVRKICRTPNPLFMKTGFTLCSTRLKILRARRALHGQSIPASTAALFHAQIHHIFPLARTQNKTARSENLAACPI